MGITTQMNLSSAESDEYLSNSLLSLLDYTPYWRGQAENNLGPCRVFCFIAYVARTARAYFAFQVL